jgi:hypothetical protein
MLAHAIQVLVLHAEALVLSSLATVETRHSSSAALILTFHSRLENLAAKCVASFWDAANTPALHCATQDCAHPVENSSSKSAIVESMNGKQSAVMVKQKLL